MKLTDTEQERFLSVYIYTYRERERERENLRAVMYQFVNWMQPRQPSHLVAVWERGCGRGSPAATLINVW
jgi:hypothetical protein